MSHKRLGEVLTVFSRVGLTHLKEKKTPLEEQETPVKLRLAFELLGPSFVKIGQILSTRGDLLPEVYIRELEKLQDDVPPMPKDVALAAIEKELGQPFSAVFSELDENPLASASVAQTHRARLLDGQEVIVKIQRPNLAAQTREDLGLLVKLARRIPASWIPMVDLPKVLSQLQASIEAEIDFRNESQHLRDFARKNADIACLGVPKVFEDFTTSQMLVESYIPGIRINNHAELLAAGYDLEDIGQKLMLSFIKQVFKDGYFHGDPHPGNLIVHEGKIFFIDFGIMGRLEEGIRANLNEILYNFTSQDVEGMTRAILSIAKSEEQVNMTQLGRDVERMMTKYGNINLGILSLSDLLDDQLQIFQKHGLQADPAITILGKAMLQIEGVFRELAPDVDLMTLAKKYFMENMKTDILSQVLNRDTLLIELLYLLRNGKSIPRRLNQLMEQILNGRILINHDLIDYPARSRQLQGLTNRLILSILFLALILGGSLLSFQENQQTLANTLLIGAALLFIWLLALILQSERRGK